MFQWRGKETFQCVRKKKDGALCMSAAREIFCTRHFQVFNLSIVRTKQPLKNFIVSAVASRRLFSELCRDSTAKVASNENNTSWDFVRLCVFEREKNEQKRYKKKSYF